MHAHRAAPMRGRGPAVSHPRICFSVRGKLRKMGRSVRAQHVVFQTDGCGSLISKTPAASWNTHTAGTACRAPSAASR